MRRRWRMDGEAFFLCCAAWFAVWFVVFAVVHPRHHTLRVVDVVLLVVWLGPLLLAALVVAAHVGIFRGIWDARPRRVWESSEDAREVHKRERK